MTGFSCQQTSQKLVVFRHLKVVTHSPLSTVIKKNMRREGSTKVSNTQNNNNNDKCYSDEDTFIGKNDQF